jgi:hypothetical protein
VTRQDRRSVNRESSIVNRKPIAELRVEPIEEPIEETIEELREEPDAGFSIDDSRFTIHGF